MSARTATIATKNVTTSYEHQVALAKSIVQKVKNVMRVQITRDFEGPDPLKMADPSDLLSFEDKTFSKVYRILAKYTRTSKIGGHTKTSRYAMWQTTWGKDSKGVPRQAFIVLYESDKRRREAEERLSDIIGQEDDIERGIDLMFDAIDLSTEINEFESKIESDRDELSRLLAIKHRSKGTDASISAIRIKLGSDVPKLAKLKADRTKLNNSPIIKIAADARASIFKHSCDMLDAALESSFYLDFGEAIAKFKSITGLHRVELLNKKQVSKTTGATLQVRESESVAEEEAEEEAEDDQYSDEDDQYSDEDDQYSDEDEGDENASGTVESESA